MFEPIVQCRAVSGSGGGGVLDTIGQCIDVGRDMGDIVEIGDIADKTVVMIDRRDGGTENLFPCCGAFREGSSPCVVRAELGKNRIEGETFFKKIFTDMGTV